MAVEDTGGPLNAPVGKGILSRMFDVFGNAIDREAVPTDIQWRSVHRAPPPLVRRSTQSEIFETGIKVIDVLVPLELQGRKADRGLAQGLLEKVGLGHRMDHFPVQMSGGEQQRTALARAFIHRPMILFADEPTGNLDAESKETVEDMLFALNRESGTTLVIVTHDAALAERTGRIIALRGGRLHEDRRVNAAAGPAAG
jgi:energy-coupling factor transporter ATP-binding protein EcfA2